jgi:hypothetical protein
VINNRKVIEFVVTCLPVLALLFVIGERTGVWDKLRGLDLVEDVANRLDTSYAANVVRQIGPDEKAWKPLIALIYRYSTTKFPKDKQPRMVARALAVASAKLDLGGGRFAEWTAPSTPFMILYGDWPTTGRPLSNSDVWIAGTLGDLRTWIAQSKSDLRFVVMDVSLVLITISLGLLLWRINHSGPAS